MLLLLSGTVSTGEASAASGNMVLLGQGKAKYLGLITVYHARLYSDSETDPSDILGAMTSKCLELEYATAVAKKDFIKAADTILQRQHQPEVLAQVAPAIGQLHDAYSDVSDGDIYQLCYTAPSQRTTLYRNGVSEVNIEGSRFAEIYFGIWLGDMPLDKELRNKLLGLEG